MKVLQLGKFFPIRGGVEKVMYDLTEGLGEKGIQCDMLCAADEPQTIVLNEHAKVICVKSLFKFAATMISPSMVFHLRRISSGYDIIHVHHPDPMACLALFCSGFKGKVVLHWHSDILKQRLLLQFYKPLQSWLIRRADLIVGTSPVYVNQSECLKDCQHKVTYLPIGIVPMVPDPTVVASIRSRYPGKKLIYSLGRLVGYKGFEYLVEAARYLPDNYHVAIGGDGPLRPDLEHKIHQWGLENKVELLGYVDQKDSADFFGACDLFCLSSIWKTEAYAIVQLEAMSCYKPVVATKIPGSGVSWVNHHGFSGYNVEPENGKALADAILRITSDEKRYQQLCRQARELYESEYVYNKMIDRCIALYKNLYE